MENTLVKLPITYTERMQQLLGVEFDAYMESFEKPHYTGLRVNTLKISPEEFLKISPFELTPIPWTENGFYYNPEEQPAKHPYYYAGLYYIQEPSAMTPAALLPIEEGDRVLDLCAAPGGKTTELAAKLNGTGVLVSNDISNSRAKALLKNVELAGVRNAIVASEPPEKLANYFEGYFDKILVDAPCSGEGMFRKDSGLIKSWEEYGVEYFSNLQKEIILQAARMLRPGGKMVYSTCTFSPEENEATIAYLKEHCPEFKVLEVPRCEGFGEGHPEWIGSEDEELKNCVRLWPHKIQGEGHFIALLQKGEEDVRRKVKTTLKPVKLSEEATQFLKQISVKSFKKNHEMYAEHLNSLPAEMVDLKGLRLLRSGMYLGDEKKNRFEPSQPLANALRMEEFPNVINLSIEDERVIRYLKGETIEVEDKKAKGYHLVCVDGYSLGWGKLAKGTLKNKYHAGWRWL